MYSFKELSFNFLLIGGVPYNNINNFYLNSNTNYFVIDAREKDLIKHDVKNYKTLKIFNEIIHTSRGSLYLNEDERSSSLYKANMDIIQRYRTDNVYSLKEIIPVTPKKYKDIGIDNISFDLLSVYIQGSELDFFFDNQDLMRECSVIITNHYYEEIYKDTDNFVNINQIMNNNGFKFISNLTLSKFKDKYIEGLVVYINKKTKSEEQLTKLCLILFNLGLFENARWEILNNSSGNNHLYKKILSQYAKDQYTNFNRLLNFINSIRFILKYLYYPLLYFDLKLKKSKNVKYLIICQLIDFNEIYKSKYLKIIKGLFK